MWAAQSILRGVVCAYDIQPFPLGDLQIGTERGCRSHLDLKWRPYGFQMNSPQGLLDAAHGPEFWDCSVIAQQTIWCCLCIHLSSDTQKKWPNSVR